MFRPRRVFTRSHHERWTREVFVITRVDTCAAPVTYRVKDLIDVEISGRFRRGIAADKVRPECHLKD